MSLAAICAWAALINWVGWLVIIAVLVRVL